MRAGLVIALLGFAGPLALGTPVLAEAEQGRVATMGFESCLEIIAEMTDDLGAAPVELARTADLRSVRFDARDGSVTLTCNRADGKLTLTRMDAPPARTAVLR
jgi:hypothetical protein